MFSQRPEPEGGFQVGCGRCALRRRQVECKGVRHGCFVVVEPQAAERLSPGDRGQLPADSHRQLQAPLAPWWPHLRATAHFNSFCARVCFSPCVSESPPHLWAHLCIPVHLSICAPPVSLCSWVLAPLAAGGSSAPAGWGWGGSWQPRREGPEEAHYRPVPSRICGEHRTSQAAEAGEVEAPRSPLWGRVGPN